MTANTKRRLVRICLLLLMASVSLPASGCLAAAVTAGVAAGGAAGYAYYQGAVPHDFPTSMDQSWEATKLALGDLGMPIVFAERDNDGARIESRTGDGDKVHVNLTPRASRVPSDGQWTHIEVRVAMFGDGPVSERVLKQIESRLGLPGQQPNQQPSQQPRQVPATIEPQFQTNRQVPVVTGPATTSQTAPPQNGGEGAHRPW